MIANPITHLGGSKKRERERERERERCGEKKSISFPFERKEKVSEEHYANMHTIFSSLTFFILCMNIWIVSYRCLNDKRVVP